MLLQRTATVSALALVLAACSGKKAEDNQTMAQPSASAESTSRPGASASGKAMPAAPSQAVAHLSDSCKLMAQVDVRALLAHPQMKEHVTPSLSQLGGGEDKESKDLAEFLEDAGIVLTRDVHQAAGCALSVESQGGDKGKPPDGYLVLGGELNADKVQSALKKLAAKPEHQRLEVEGATAVKRKGGVVGQAADGALIIASNEESFRKALPANASPDRLGLPLSEAVGIVILEDASKQITSSGGPQVPPAVKSMKQATLTFDTKTNQLRAKVQTGSEKDAQTAEGFLKPLLAQIGKANKDPKMADVLKGLGEATIATEGADLVLSVTLSEAALKQLAEQIGSAMKTAKSDTGKPEADKPDFSKPHANGVLTGIGESPSPTKPEKQ